MRSLVLPALLFLAGGVLAQEVTIRGVNRAGKAGGWVFADNAWLRNVDILTVKFGVSTSTPSAGLPMKWGFFGAEKNLLGVFTGVPRVQVRSGTYQRLPEVLKPGETYSVSFPIPPSIASGEGRWRAFLVELGYATAVARAAYPATTETADLRFEGQDAKPELAAADVKPVIKRISRYRNSLPAEVDGKWLRGLNTLRVTVQVDSGAEANDFYARVYFFDGEKAGIFSWQNPPQVGVKTTGDYASLPGVWKNGESHDLHFPIRKEHDQGPGQWRTAIVLFGNTKAVVAESYPVPGKAGEFEFPEKERLALP